jgi:steroid delta-isomerase-like uncharacterized protein
MVQIESKPERRKEDIIRKRREEIVHQHVEAENNGDLDGMIASFHSPHYQVIPMAAIVDGEQAVREMFGGVLQGFPDFHFDIVKLYHDENAVVLEGRMSGTHEGEFAGMQPQGRKMDIQAACIFDFDEDRLINETVYFDFATLQRQLAGEPVN